MHVPRMQIAQEIIDASVNSLMMSIADTVDASKHIQFLQYFKREWQRGPAHVQITEVQWNGVMRDLQYHADAILDAIVQTRLHACLRYCWLSDTRNRRQVLREQISALTAMLKTPARQWQIDEWMQATVRGVPHAHIVDTNRWLSSISMSNPGDSNWLNPCHAYENARTGDPEWLVLLAGWLCVTSFVVIVAWNSDENVQAFAALDILTPRGAVIEAGNKAYARERSALKQRAQHLNRQFHMDIERFVKHVLAGNCTVRRSVRNIRSSTQTCISCRNTDMIDAVTLQRIPPHSCWQAPNGVCWDQRTLLAMHQHNPNGQLPDRSGPLPQFPLRRSRVDEWL